ncbi:MAG: glutamate 5-kinase [Gammaproteobacteria bacterium]|nr:glutamate 5-kinase [Pseudomonadota bacterium]MBU1656466.1 glutamate 5-kinase [Gammaproteobacteria bacterium]
MGWSESDQRLIDDARRVVVKIGSNVLTTPVGLDEERIGHLAAQMAGLIDAGREIIIVSSGAIAAGFRRLGLAAPPRTIPEKQAAAAAGQASLIEAWDAAFAATGHKVAQVLLTSEDLRVRRRYINAHNTLFTLLEWGVVPVINENDTVVVAEIKFGDNDALAARVTSLTEADLLVILTDIDGLYSADPRQKSDAELIPAVDQVTPELLAVASAAPGAVGRGGMRSKIGAGAAVARGGRPTVITSGLAPRILTDLFGGRGRGTLLRPVVGGLSLRKQWIDALDPRGRIVVDDGAVRALLQNGKSLLPVGIVEVEGQFMAGSPVDVVDPRGRHIARGLVKYRSGEIRRIMGCRSVDIDAVLGRPGCADVVIHRDDMVVLDETLNSAAQTG